MSGRGACSLWMGDIDQYMDERVIAEAFSMMGEHVVGVKLMKDHKTGQNRNYCFVELTTKEAVHLALKRLVGLPLPNYPAKRFKLNYSLRDQGQTGSSTEGSAASSQYGKEFSCYVGGLNFSTSDEELVAVFAHYKSFKEAKIVRDDQQRSKGFGFVRFFNEGDREAAIHQMNGAVGPMGVTLKVDRAVTKREMMVNSANNYQPTSGPGAAPLPSGPMMGGGYPYPYQQGPQPYSSQQQQVQAPAPQQQQQQPPAPKAQPAKTDVKDKQADDDETLEDHSAPVNMVATNLAFIQANQEFYKKLADSRWNPVTSYTATLSEVCK